MGLIRAHIALTAAVLTFGAVPAVSAADSVANFYKGKKINIAVGYGAGGGYSTYMRLLGASSTLLEIAPGTRRNHIVPAGLAALRARDQVIEGEIAVAAAVLTGE